MKTIMQFGEVVDFAPVDYSSSVWAAGGAGDIGTVIRDVKQGVEDDHREGFPSQSEVAPAECYCPASMLLPRSFSDALRVVEVREDTLRCAFARLEGVRAQDHVNYWALESPDEDTVITRGIVDPGVAPAAEQHCGMNTNYCDARGPCYDAQTSPPGTCDTVNHGAAHTRAFRKSQLVGRRGVQRPQSMSKSCGHQSRQWPLSSGHHDVAEPKLCNEKGKGYEFLFQKVLRASDVSSLGRIILPKKDAERYLPFLIMGEGIMISLKDYHCGILWTARFRFWPNNRSRMYLLEHVGDFVNYHHLQVGDLLLCYRNEQGGYVIRGQKVGNPGKGLTSMARENALTTPTKTASHQFVGGESNASSSSENGTEGEVGDGKPFPGYQDGLYKPHQFQQDGLRTGVPASYNPLEQGWGFDPMQYWP